MASQQQIKTSRDWQDISLSESLGLNITEDAETTSDDALIQAMNVVSRGNYLEIDNGIFLKNHPVYGDPKKACTVVLSDGVRKTFLFTDQAIYEGVTGAWKGIADVSSGLTEIPLNLAAAAFAGVITVNDTTDFTVGDILRIELDNGKYHTTQLQSIGAGAPGTFTLHDSMPSAAAIGKKVTKIYAFNSRDYALHWVQVPFSDSIIFVSPAENVKTLDLNTLAIIDTPDLPTNTRAVSVTAWNNSIFLFNTTENSIRYPRRYRYSAAGSITDWSSVNDAGFGDLYDNSDELLNGHEIGPYLAIYRTNSITRLEPTGDATKRFDSPTVVTGVGLISTDAMIPIDSSTHIIMSRENVHRYSGGFSVEDIGDNIVRNLFGKFGTVDLTDAHNIFGLYDKDDKKVCIFYPTTASASGYPNKCYIYNITKGKWTERDFGRTLSGCGEIEAVGTYSILPGDSASYKRILLLGDPAIDTTFEYSNAYTDDLGVSIPVTIETKDFGVADMKCLLDRLEVTMMNLSTATIYYSKDRGANYVSMGTGASATVLHKRFWKQIMFNTIRFKIVTSTYTKLVGMAFKTKIAAEW